MLFTLLEEKGIDWNGNAAERALRSSVVIRKITYGNQSDFVPPIQCGGLFSQLFTEP